MAQAQRPERHEFRLALAHVDRGINVERVVVLARHPSETLARLTLRALTQCLLYRDDLEVGPGLAVPDAPDFLAHDLSGRLSVWVGCDIKRIDLVRKVVQHNSDADVHLVFSGPTARTTFDSSAATLDRQLRGWERVQLWTFEQSLIDGLAASEALRQRWAVTIVGDHAYVDAEGNSYDGAITRG